LLPTQHACSKSGYKTSYVLILDTLSGYFAFNTYIYTNSINNDIYSESV